MPMIALATRRRLSQLLLTLGAAVAFADLAVSMSGKVAWWPRHLSLLMSGLIFAGILTNPPKRS
jgi:hypothetical protein